MTELSFLLKLLLEHKLTKPTQMAIKERIQEVESRMIPQVVPRGTLQSQYPPLQQAPSMQAKIDSLEADKLNQPPQQLAGPVPTTQQAASALAYRQQLIQGALTESGGNFEKGRTSPRKY